MSSPKRTRRSPPTSMDAPSSKPSVCLPRAAFLSPCSAPPWSMDAASKAISRASLRWRKRRCRFPSAGSTIAARFSRSTTSPRPSSSRSPRPRLEGETFLVADTEPISVADLVTAMREGLGRPPHLLRVPLGAVKRLMATFGKESGVGTPVGEFRDRRRQAPRHRLGPSRQDLRRHRRHDARAQRFRPDLAQDFVTSLGLLRRSTSSRRLYSRIPGKAGWHASYLGRNERLVERDGLLADGLGGELRLDQARAHSRRSARASRHRRPCAVMASASASASSTGTVSAVSSRMAISRQPGVSVAIIGRPQAAASSRLFGRPSRREASTAKCAPSPTPRGYRRHGRASECRRQGEFAKLLRRERSRIFPVGIAGKEKLEPDAARGGERIGLDQRDHALVGEHAPDIGRGDGRRRLWQRHEMLRVDARPRNQVDASLRHAEAETNRGRQGSARWCGFPAA